MGKKKLRLLCGVLAGALLIGGAFAYFSGRAQTAENNFNIVKGGDPNDGDPIVINEPAWDAENAVDVEPGQIIPKDPSIESLAEYDGWVMMKVTVPRILAKKEGDTEYKEYDAFVLRNGKEDGDEWWDRRFNDEYWSDVTSYRTHEKNAEDEWCVVDADGNSVYYFMYNNVLPAGKETEPLFESIQEQDFVMVKDNLSGSLDIDAAIVQKINPETGETFDFKSVFYFIFDNLTDF